jgi:Matrixin
MGDIRIGGYNFGSSQLAMAFLPPPVNNYSLAGDIQFNTGQAFNINGFTYDLFTVAMHEFGHALGLYHSTVTGAVMQATYGGSQTGLTTDDIQGIQSVYSAGAGRSVDQFGGTNTSFAAAANLTGFISGSNQTALVTNLNLTSAGEKEYYSVVAPSGTGSTVTINLQSSGLSQLEPTLWVYSSTQSLLGYTSGSGHYGTTLTLNLTNKIAAGAQFYIKVTGSDSSAFSTGVYALTMSFAGNPLPSVPLPNTQVANGTPLSGGGGLALTEPGDSTTPEILQLFNQQNHGNGCNCPYCRGAAAAAQKDPLVVAGLAQTTTEHASQPAATPTLTIGLPSDLAKEELVPVFASLWQSPTEAAAVTPSGQVPVSVPADAFFADEAWLNELGLS